MERKKMENEKMKTKKTEKKTEKQGVANKRGLTPTHRLIIGLAIFIFIAVLVMVEFNINASFLDIGFIAVSSLLAIPCYLALDCHNGWFTWKKKLLIAFFLLVIAVLTEMILHKGFVFSDTFIILCFLVIAVLCNLWFSKWNHSNIPLLPQLSVDLCYMATWMLSFNLFGMVTEEDVRPMLFSTFSIIAIVLAHFLLLGVHVYETPEKTKAPQKDATKEELLRSAQASQIRQSTSIIKRFLMAAFMCLMLFIGLLVLIIIKAFTTI